MRKARDPFLEEALTLGGGDRGAGTVIIVEGLCVLDCDVGGKKGAYQVVVVLVVDEVFFREEVAECGVAECLRFVGAELQHGDYVCRCEVHTGDLVRQDQSIIPA